MTGDSFSSRGGGQLPAIGNLRHRIVLEARTQAASGAEAIADSFATVDTVWGQVDQIAGGMIVSGAQTEERVTHRIVIRNRTDLSSWRFLTWDSKRMQVRSTRAADDRKRFLEILAEEIT